MILLQMHLQYLDCYVYSKSNLEALQIPKESSRSVILSDLAWGLHLQSLTTRP